MTSPVFRVLRAFPDLRYALHQVRRHPALVGLVILALLIGVLVAPALNAAPAAETPHS